MIDTNAHRRASALRPILGVFLSLFTVGGLLFAPYSGEITNAVSSRLTPMLRLESAPLGAAEAPVLPADGGLLRIPLTAPGLKPLSLDDPNAQSRAVVFENGIALREVIDPSQLNGAGTFFQNGPELLVAPTAPNAQYSLVVPGLDPRFTTEVLRAEYRLWLAIVVVCFLTALFAGRAESVRGYRLVFFVPLALFVVYLVTSGAYGTNDGPSKWDTFSYTPDSDSYVEEWGRFSVRPPAYPLLIGAVRSFDPEAIKAPTVPPSQMPITNMPGHYLLRVVQLQKMILAASMLLSAWLFMSLIPPPLVASAFFLIVYFGFVTHQIDFIMSETLAQAMTFVVCGFFAHFLALGRIRSLLALALFAGIFYQTRSAGIFAALFLGVAALAVIVRDRKLLSKKNIAAAIVYGLVFFSPSIYRYFESGFYFSAPMYADARIPFALQFAEATDVDIMPTEQSKTFLTKAVALRGDIHDLVKRVDNPPISSYYLGANLYKVAHPVADEMQLNTLQRRELFVEVSGPLLKRHWRKYKALAIESFKFGINNLSRLKYTPYLTPWQLMGLIAIGAVVVRGREGVAALALLAGHLAHLAVVCTFDIPIQRYTFATEFLAVLSAACVAGGLVRMARATAAWSMCRLRRRKVPAYLLTDILAGTPTEAAR